MRTMRIAFIADEITSFIKDHDSTWSIMQAAFNTRDEVYYAHASSLSVSAGEGLAEFVQLNKEFFKFQETNKTKLVEFPIEVSSEALELDSMDLIFMRSDPPVDTAYITACQILALCKKARVINNPNSLITYNEKLSILNFPALITETLVSGYKAEIKNFITKLGKAVIKPLDGMAGSGIFVVEAGDKNLGSILEVSLERSSTLMIQKYIPEISQGDKRIVMINGEVKGALIRVPTKKDHRANLAAGGNFAKYELTKRDKEICASLKSFLVENGILLAGVDVIGDYLTEINITSPTCLQEIDRLEGNKGEAKLAYEILKALGSKINS